MKLIHGRTRIGLILAGAAIANFTGGCATPTIRPQGYNLVTVVPGLGGDGDIYARTCFALRDNGSKDRMQVFNWGLSWGLFFITLNSDDLHHSTEIKFADMITEWRVVHPGSRI